jgi:hypothetical protein
MGATHDHNSVKPRVALSHRVLPILSLSAGAATFKLLGAELKSAVMGTGAIEQRWLARIGAMSDSHAQQHTNLKDHRVIRFTTPRGAGGT